MIPLADWSIRNGDTERRIELFRGDLSELPADHAVDILVVSAFPNDYIPTRGSLIGALERKGIRDTSIPYLFRSVQYADCCEADFVKLSAVCGKICESL